MKSKLSVISILGLWFLCNSLFAQSSYKGISLERDSKDIYCILVSNDNEYPCKVRFEYKINHRDNTWHTGFFDEDIPPFIKKVKKFCAEGEIKAIRITLVDIKKPTLLEQFNKSQEDYYRNKFESEQQ